MTRLGSRSLLTGWALLSSFCIACGDDGNESAGSCLRVAERYVDKRAECGLVEDREEEIGYYGCDQVEQVSEQAVDSCLQKLEQLTCATVNAVPAECQAVFSPK